MPTARVAVWALCSLINPSSFRELRWRAVVQRNVRLQIEHIYIHTYTYVHIRTYTYIHMYVCIYVLHCKTTHMVLNTIYSTCLFNAGYLSQTSRARFCLDCCACCVSSILATSWSWESKSSAKLSFKRP